MKRAVSAIAFFLLGLLISWQSALLSIRLADKFDWPLFQSYKYGCRDLEHCHSSWWGNILIVLSIFGPALVWGCIGFTRFKSFGKRTLVTSILVLIAATNMFYAALYAFVFP